MYNNRNKLIFVLFFLLVLIPSAIAPSPFIQQSSGGLAITQPKNPYFIFNTTFSLHFHVFNSTNYALPNANVNCTIHIYNQSNNHIVKANTTDDSNGIDEYITLNYSNINISGIYSFIINCNSSSKEYGFLSDYIEITDNGKANEPINAFYIVVVLLPFLIGLMFSVSAFTMNDKHHILKIFGYLISISSFTFAIYYTGEIITKFYYFPEILSALTTTLYIYVIILIVVLVYFIIYIFKLVTKSIAEKKVNDLEY